MEKISYLHKALCEPNRLRILSALADNKELCACQITELLEETGATVSRHLSVMVQAGILSKRKQGRWIHFRLNRENATQAPLIDWSLERLAATRKIHRDRKRLERILDIPCETLCKIQKTP